MKETEALWLASHPEILQKYRGQYIAVSGERVIAHGKHLRAVLQKARKIDPEPLIDKVPAQDTLIL
ncbi:MAG: hypothetical protein HYW07_11930 [Candidatus Latescibacteria bacterium]|nr:hypothetical protein [Candidatus Latescibacterota bacterium]